MSDNSAALPFSTKFLYGFGSIAYGIKDNAFAYFLLFVYVQVFGLAPNLAGLAILVMLVFDAISDPLIGYFSDNRFLTHSSVISLITLIHAGGADTLTSMAQYYPLRCRFF